MRALEKSREHERTTCKLHCKCYVQLLSACVYVQSLNRVVLYILAKGIKEATL